MSAVEPRMRLSAVPDQPVAPAAAPIRVVIADDHALMRRNLRTLLDSEHDIEVTAEADYFALAERHVHGHRPDVLILDMTLPDGPSLRALEAMRRAAPATRIVVMSVDDAPGFAQRALAAGASGFVPKDRAVEDLAEAVRAATRGETYVSGRISEGIDSLTGAELSRRETEVLRLIALGYTSVEIAGQLHLSPRTIETHRARIHRKLGMRRRSELVQYALRHGLLRA
jgi:two-component system, NarL family, response regulator NreC